MSDLTIIITTIAWCMMGYYGCFILFRSTFNITAVDLLACLMGCLPGPIILIIGLVSKYSSDKIVFKQYDKKSFN